MTSEQLTELATAAHQYAHDNGYTGTMYSRAFLSHLSRAMTDAGEAELGRQFFFAALGVWDGD